MVGAAGQILAGEAVQQGERRICGSRGEIFRTGSAVRTIRAVDLRGMRQHADAEKDWRGAAGTVRKEDVAQPRIRWGDRRFRASGSPLLFATLPIGTGTIESLWQRES